MCQLITNIIKQRDDHWAVYDESGKKRLSKWYTTKAEAEQRLREIEYFKHNSKKIMPTRREKDPTGQAGNRLRAKVDIASRIRRTRSKVLGILESMPVKEITVNKVKYEYEINPLRIDSLFDELLSIFYQALELNQSRTPWFFNEYLGTAWRDGTVQAFERIKVLAESAAPDQAEAMRLDSVLTSPEYTRRFELISARAFEDMKGFASDAAKDLGFILGRGVALGQSPRVIARDIRKKFTQIEGYRSLRIARTEVNSAYTKARNEQNQDARDRLGLDLRVMHISALVESTRPTHAARHGKIYLPEEQQEWWQEGSNLINCLCSTVEIVYIDGEPTNKALIKKQRDRGRAFFG